VHQHGYAHRNHGPARVKYEFGAVRSERDQWEELTAGRKMLERALGGLFFPVFSAPYGWYEPQLLPLLRRAGFAALSGIDGTLLRGPVPVISPDVDCFRWNPPRERPWEEVAAEWRARPVGAFRGIMLHPRPMSDESVSVLVRELPELLAGARTGTFAEILAAGLPPGNASQM
jgi:peptidoglycan/xylan/chitin deacetylase (PgdA/CDA1 family)